MNGLRAVRWLRSGTHDQQVADAAAAGGILVLALLEAALRSSTPRFGGLLLVMGLYSIPLLWRHRWPVPVLAVVIACGPALSSTVRQGGLISYVLAGLLAAFTVGRSRPRPVTWLGPTVILGIGWGYYLVAGGVLSDYVFVALLYGGAWTVGFALREREQRILSLESEALEVRAESAERTRAAVTAERRRIARELHDLVSHSISVIAIQTQVVRMGLPESLAPEKQKLASIEQAAHQALSEMRRLLAVLRDADSTAELEPVPGVNDLPALLRDHESAGGGVRLTIRGEVRPLPSGVDLAAYRVLQEALTNSRKHSMTAAPVEIDLCYERSRIAVTVVDRGPARHADEPGSGQGLIGMKERVDLYGGSLQVGADCGGAWTVRAVLPTDGRSANDR